MLTTAEARELARRLLDRQPTHSYVADGLELAAFVLYRFGDDIAKAEVDNLAEVQARCTDLLNKLRELKLLAETVHRLKEGDAVLHEEAVNDLVTQVLGAQ